jgi:hypothetical protein
MAKKGIGQKATSGDAILTRKKELAAALSPPAGKPSALLDTRIIYCGLRRAQSSRDNLEQLAKLPAACVDLIYIDPAPVSEVELPFNSNRNYEVFWGETKEERAFEDRDNLSSTAPPVESKGILA